MHVFFVLVLLKLLSKLKCNSFYVEPFLSTYETVIQPEISTIKWKKSCTVSIQQVVGILNLLHFSYKRYAENSGNFILFYFIYTALNHNNSRLKNK